MKNFLLLSKIFFKNGFAVNKKKGNQKASFKTIFIILTIGTILFLLTEFVLFKYKEFLNMDNETITILVFLIVSLMTAIMTFFQMQTSIFQTPDFEMLASFPIKGEIVATAKILSIYFFNFILDIPFTLPTIILYTVFSKNFYGLLICFIGSILAPMIPILLSSIVGVLVSIITSKSSNREKVSTIISLLVVILIFSGSALISFLVPNSSNITTILPYYHWLYRSFNPSNFLDLIWFLLLNIGAGVACFFLLKIAYVPLNQVQTVSSKKEYVSKNKSEKNLTIKRFLLKKEFKMYVQNSKYLLNTFIAPIILLLGGLCSCLIPSLAGAPDESASLAVQSYFQFQLPILGLILSGLACTTCYSFSVEGKNFEMLFAYPLRKKDIINAKLKVGLYVLIPAFLISVTLLLVIIGAIKGWEYLTLINVINAYSAPIFGTFTGNLLGIIVGLRWAKFDFTDENDIFKKSAVAGFNMLFTTLINLIGVFIIVFFNLDIITNLNHNIPFSFLISLGFYSIINIIIYICIKKFGEVLFSNALER